MAEDLWDDSIVLKAKLHSKSPNKKDTLENKD